MNYDFILSLSVLLIGAVLAYWISCKMLPPEQRSSRRNMALVIFIFWAFIARWGLNLYFQNRMDLDAALQSQRIMQVLSEKHPEHYQKILSALKKIIQEEQHLDSQKVIQIGELYLGGIIQERLRFSSPDNIVLFFDFILPILKDIHQENPALCHQNLIQNGAPMLLQHQNKVNTAQLEHIFIALLEDEQRHQDLLSPEILAQEMHLFREHLKPKWGHLLGENQNSNQDSFNLCELSIDMYLYFNQKEHPQRIELWRSMMAKP